jgi:hypothetical protein
MKVSIKDFAVSMEVKNKGVEFEVYDNADDFLGDLVISKSKIVWCPGRTSVEHGHPINWNDFIKHMQSLPKS